MKIIKEVLLREKAEENYVQNIFEETRIPAKLCQELLKDLPEDLNLDDCTIDLDFRKLKNYHGVPYKGERRGGVDSSWYDIYLVVASYENNDCRDHKGWKFV